MGRLEEKGAVSRNGQAEWKGNLSFAITRNQPSFTAPWSSQCCPCGLCRWPPTT